MEVGWWVGRERRIREPYPIDLTDARWARVAPSIPLAMPCRRRRRTVDVRLIVDAVLRLARTGCWWRNIRTSPRPGARSAITTAVGVSMGPGTRSAAHYWASGSGPRKRGAKPPRARRSSTPEASRRSRERGPRGYDAGKRITGRKRRIVVGTSGSVPAVTVHAAASIRDRDGAKSWFPSGRWVVLPARSRSGRTGRMGEARRVGRGVLFG